MTSSQRQWLQLVRASHRYHEVTGSTPVEVLNFSGFYIRNCINCVRNCEDHSLLDLTSAVHYMKYLIYHFKYGNLNIVSDPCSRSEKHDSRGFIAHIWSGRLDLILFLCFFYFFIPKTFHQVFSLPDPLVLTSPENWSSCSHVVILKTTFAFVLFVSMKIVFCPQMMMNAIPLVVHVIWMQHVQTQMDLTTAIAVLGLLVMVHGVKEVCTWCTEIVSNNILLVT